ncbi:class I SAM-dependent methyltransferase [Candidatus Parcubacteria bacterium]|nr:MAG: class I SAM-dependent methyltransferase [Candidatus Parcubacteria bacterium]
MKERPDRPYSREDLIKAINSLDNSIPSEGRSAGEYLHQLNIRTENLEGKRVLDLGSGSNLNLARQLPEEGIQAEVISFSPGFYHGKTWNERAERADEARTLTVAGMAEELPFADGSFDTVLAFYVTIYLQDSKRIEIAISEMIRVLKPGGAAYIGPIFVLDPVRKVRGIDTNTI